MRQRRIGFLRCRLTRAKWRWPAPFAPRALPRSPLLRSSPPLAGASVLSASRLEPLVPFPLPSPARFSRSAREPSRGSRRQHSPPRLLTAAACSGLRSAQDWIADLEGPSRTVAHRGLDLLVTQD